MTRKGLGDSDRKTRVLVADDHDEVRHVLVNLLNLQPDLEVVGEAESGREAVDLAFALDPEVILLDIRMPEMDGLEVIEELRRRRSTARIVALSAHEDETYISEAIRRGADGYILKGQSMRDIIEAVREVVRGKTVLPPEVAEPLTRRFREDDAMLKAFLTILAEEKNEKEVVARFCQSVGEILNAAWAILLRIPDNGHKTGSESKGGTELYAVYGDMEESRIGGWEEILPDPELKRLVGLTAGGQPVVCNDYLVPAGERGERWSLVVIPVPSEEKGNLFALCARTQPFSMPPSLLNELRCLANQVGVLLDDQLRRERISRLEGKLARMREVLAFLLSEEAEEKGLKEILRKISLFLEAEGVFLVCQGMARGGSALIESWGLDPKGLSPMLGEIASPVCAREMREGGPEVKPLSEEQTRFLLGDTARGRARLALIPFRFPGKEGLGREGSDDPRDVEPKIGGRRGEEAFPPPGGRDHSESAFRIGGKSHGKVRISETVEGVLGLVGYWPSSIPFLDDRSWLCGVIEGLVRGLAGLSEGFR